MTVRRFFNVDAQLNAPLISRPLLESSGISVAQDFFAFAKDEIRIFLKRVRNPGAKFFGRRNFILKSNRRFLNIRLIYRKKLFSIIRNSKSDFYIFTFQFKSSLVNGRGLGHSPRRRGSGKREAVGARGRLSPL